MRYNPLALADVASSGRRRSSLQLLSAAQASLRTLRESRSFPTPLAEAASPERSLLTELF